jgi:hypothetical protein
VLAATILASSLAFIDGSVGATANYWTEVLPAVLVIALGMCGGPNDSSLQ